jgi:Alpha-L-arabinofuranosidase B (ABFB) domain
MRRGKRQYWHVRLTTGRLLERCMLALTYRFRADATFCPQAGRSGTGTSFASLNFPTRFIRHFNNTVYIASNGGPNAFGSSTSWAADVSWAVSAPWAPLRDRGRLRAQRAGGRTNQRSASKSAVTPGRVEESPLAASGRLANSSCASSR